MNKNKLLMSQPAKKKIIKTQKKQKQIKKCILEKTIKKTFKNYEKNSLTHDNGKEYW